MKHAIVLLFALLLPAQDRPGPQSDASRFGVSSRLVIVPVNVTDRDGRSVEDLEAEDFELLDNSSARRVSVDNIDTGVAPIALTLAVQSSGISLPVLEKVRKIAAMIQPLVLGDYGCAALVDFAGTANLIQECTSDTDALQHAFDQLHPREAKKACMLDAVRVSVDHLRTKQNYRRVLLLISESRDRGSTNDLAGVLVAAQSAGVAIYAATYSAFKTGFTTINHGGAPDSKTKTTTDNPMGTHNGAAPSGNRQYGVNERIQPPEQRVDILGTMGELMRLGKENTTRALASATGGITLSFLRQRELEDAIQRLSTGLHSQYVLSFVPQSPAPGYHKLEVRVKRPGDFLVRARPGYWIGE